MFGLLLQVKLRRMVTWACALFLLVGAKASLGQPHKLRVTTRLVVVHVVAHDKKGEPIDGLTRGDFTILDNGEPQKIDIFSVEARRIKAIPARPLPPNVFSNWVAREGDVPVNAAVILLDGVETNFADSVYARNEIIRFLRELPLGERIALYVLGPKGLSVIQDFTDDPSPLLVAIRGFHAAPGEVPDSFSAGRDLGIPPMSVNDAAARIEADMHDRPTLGDPYFDSPMDTLKAAKTIAGRLSGLPGRKSLIWVTDRMFYPGPQFFKDPAGVLGYNGNISKEERDFQEAIRALNQADVAVYPVDAQGLVVGPLNPGSYEGRPAPPPWPGEVWTLRMDAWAKETGGRAFYYTNDIGGSIRRAIEDTKEVYTLGYYPSDIAWDGQYHHIKVPVDRKDVELRYRRGYYATTTVVNTKADPINLLAAAAGSPLDSTAIGVTVRLTPEGDPPSHQLQAAVYVDASGLTFEPENGHYDASFMVWAGEYSPQGELLKVKTKNLSFKLEEADYRKVLGGGLGVNIQEPADPKASELRVAVLDLDSLAAGSVRINLHQ